MRRIRENFQIIIDCIQEKNLFLNEVLFNHMQEYNLIIQTYIVNRLQNYRFLRFIGEVQLLMLINMTHYYNLQLEPFNPQFEIIFIKKKSDELKTLQE